jgi:bifunctional non-homologous end joining protein LigD
MGKQQSRDELRLIGRQTLELTNLDKVMFPEAKATKGDMLAYYQSVAQLMLPYLRDRPLTLRGFPAGLHGPRFWTKEVKPHYPPWLGRTEVEYSDKVIDNFMVNDVESLVALANMNIVEFHIWGSRRDRLHYPDRVVFDLDPNAGADFGLVREGALLVRDRLSLLGIDSMPMATGSRGIHVVFYVRRTHDFGRIAEWTEGFSRKMSSHYPALFTTEMLKKKRGDRVFLDWLRNNFAQTAVCPYSVRAREHAGVAVPLTWEEVEHCKVKRGSRNSPLASNLWAIRDEAALLKRGDVWGGFPRTLQSLSLARKLR